MVPETAKIVPNITNLFYVIFNPLENSLSLWHLQDAEKC